MRRALVRTSESTGRQQPYGSYFFREPAVRDNVVPLDVRALQI